MSYNELEESRDRGSPIHLYLFRVGEESNVIYAYTNAPNDITIDEGLPLGEVTYSASPMTHGNIKVKGVFDRDALGIETVRTLPLLTLFREGVPAQEVFGVIKEGHADDEAGEYQAIWSGRVVNVKTTGLKAVMSGQSLATDMKSPGLRRNYQYQCPHTLYDPQTCRADIAAATVTATVTSVAGHVVTLPTGWNGSKPLTGFRNGGRFEYTNAQGLTVYRTIRQVSETTVTLNTKPTGLGAAAEALIRLGCSRYTTDCSLLHKEVGTGESNINNFGGQPYIPGENPLSQKSIYY